MTENSILLPPKWAPGNYWRSVGARSYVVSERLVESLAVPGGGTLKLLWILWGIAGGGMAFLLDDWADRIWMALCFVAIAIVLGLYKTNRGVRWFLFGVPAYVITLIGFILFNPKSKLKKLSEEVVGAQYMDKELVFSIGEKAIVLGSDNLVCKNRRSYFLVYPRGGVEPMIIVPKEMIAETWAQVFRRFAH